jgi:hypothetical protein
LFDTTSTAASDALAATPSAARIATSPAAFATTNSTSITHRFSSLTHRSPSGFCAMQRSAYASRSLLHPHQGRHALDEKQLAGKSRGQGCRQMSNGAVKNLRIVGSTVLPLNFHEVRGFHFCSTSVAM